VDSKDRTTPGHGGVGIARRFSRSAVLALAVGLCASSLGNPFNSRVLAGEPRLVEPRRLLEKQTLELINHDRLAPEHVDETKGRAQPLAWDRRLSEVARAHSEEMARFGYFSHQAAGGQSPADRLSAAGIIWVRVGENIASCETVVEAESAFMHEPRFEHNHRWNILNPDYTRIGVGIASGSDGRLYITEDFARLP